MKRPTDAFWDQLVKLDASMASLSYYQLLGVDAGTDPESLRAAYERQIRVLHPDRHARERSSQRRATLTRVYARVAEAHRVLSHPQRRAVYDASLATGETRLREGRTEVAGAKAADPSHPQARSLFEQALPLLRAGDTRGAKAKLALAQQFEPASEAIAGALLECEPQVASPLPAPPAVEPDPVRSEVAPQPEPPKTQASETQAEVDKEFGEQPSRVHRRVPLGQSIKVSCKSWQEIESFYMQNISRGGMLLSCKTPLPIGSILELSVLTPDRESIEIPAEVVRHVEPKCEGQRPGIGIKFLLIPERARARFEALLKVAGLPRTSEAPPPAESPNTHVIEEARSLIKAGRYSQACQGLQLPVRNSPDDATLRSLFHLAAGLMARERNQEAAAHTHFERALRLAPDSPMVLRLLRDNGA